MAQFIIIALVILAIGTPLVIGFVQGFTSRSGAVKESVLEGDTPTKEKSFGPYDPDFDNMFNDDNWVTNQDSSND